MKQSNHKKYLGQLKAAKSDMIAAGIRGELQRLAQLAVSGLTSQSEREEVARVLRAKGAELSIDVECAAEAILEPKTWV